MSCFLRNVLCLLCFLWSSLAIAELEVIPLKSRTVNEVLPVLLPLVEPGGTLTGMNNQLFLRASPANRADIKRALAAIDRPVRRLVIEVALDRQQTQEARGAAASGQVLMGRHNSVQARGEVWDTRSASGENSAQRVQVVDGGQAFIQVGRSLPLPLRQAVIGPGGAVVQEGIVYHDVGNGFYARPRLHGEGVTLDISQHNARQIDRQTKSHRLDAPAAITTQELSTTVSGRLGEWIELGGVSHQGMQRQGGGFSVGTAQRSEARSIWLKVDLAQ
ncbi:secretin N-terminal domain-containing protein [Azonexus sp.]|uniref:secretin N-terminal domain-containing protein n=1 Tax=Azonexus sp. TaxID=1872668 RepID=UPI0039E403BB